MDALTKLLLKHEGLRLKPYKCPADKLTIGIGRNLEDVGITTEEAFFLLANDLKRTNQECVDQFPWFKSLSQTRQDVVVSMVFNMGLTRFKTFVNMIAALQNGNFSKAAGEMLSSKWCEQVPVRARELALMMKSGFYQ